MAIIAKAGSGGDFTPCPEGPQRLVCCDVIDLGLVEVTWQGETKRQHKCEIRWQSEHVMDSGKPFLINQRFTLSLHEKGRLRPVLEAWRGRKFTEQEAEGFDIEKLVSVSAYGNVVHNKGSKGGTFANLASIMPLPKGLESLRVSDYMRVVDREPMSLHEQGHAVDDVPAITDDDIPF